MRVGGVPYLTWFIWSILALDATISVFSGRWSTLLVCIAAFVLTLLPTFFSERFHIRLPLSFIGAFSAFVFGTLFLGEVYDFYERVWWWDIVLHGASAVGFGIIGFLFVFYLFEGDKYAAPPWALALIAFCFALAIGTLWEVFEFAMDQLFGLNMQKSGLVDTMTDLMVDAVGALVGAGSGFLWLKGRDTTLSGLIEEFVQTNQRFFRRVRDRISRDK